MIIKKIENNFKYYCIEIKRNILLDKLINYEQSKNELKI